MDWYERLSRMLMRRKYARMEGSRGPPLMPESSKAVTKIRRGERRSNSKKFERSSCGSMPSSTTGAPVPRPKRFTLRSSTNEVIDGAWFNDALRRSVAEGRLNLGNTL